jgi:hypothetical protein
MVLHPATEDTLEPPNLRTIRATPSWAGLGMTALRIIDPSR